MILLLGFAFISGLVTILAPCIWPLLPIVLSSSATGSGKSKPLGITLGIMISFSFFTLALSYIVQLFGLDPGLIRVIAVIVLVFLGLSLIIPQLSAITESAVSRLSGKLGKAGQSGNHDFISGLITGLSLGVVWTPCAGPILASIVTLAATGRVSFGVVLITLAYVIGIGIPLFIFAYGGQKVAGRTRFVSKYTGRIQQVFGVIILLTAFAILKNYDTVIQQRLLNMFPSYSQTLTGFEKNKAVTDELDKLKGKTSSTDTGGGLLNFDAPAPEFTGITKWLNTDHPLTMKELHGKVVLVDFWTYTCINCIRTLPYVTKWYDKYKDQGFVVVGVHTPEFAFEKNTQNVENAIKQYGIHYPVAQDNDYMTWNAFNNQYWPAEYLIDAKGNIRRTHFGEGEYEESEKAIQELLKEAGQQVNPQTLNQKDQTPTMHITSETYLGDKRAEPNDYVQLSDNWRHTDEYIESIDNSTLDLRFYASKVFLVITPRDGGTVDVILDGKKISQEAAGTDIKDGKVMLDTPRLYNLVDLKGNVSQHTLKLIFKSPGIQAFAFTFG